MRRQLSLKEPNLEGEDVADVQRALGLTGDAVDGVFGPQTALAVLEWKWRTGFPSNRIYATLGLPGQGLLFGELSFPSDFRARAREREGQPFLPKHDGVVLPLPPPVPRFPSSPWWSRRARRTAQV